VVALVSGAGQNRMTFASNEVLHPVVLECGVVEETAELECRVRAFTEPRAPATDFEVAIRIDRRPLPYERALSAAASFWAELPGCEPTPVPEPAREPMYSTWYSFHQRLEAAEVEAECGRAAALGMSAVIIDDGWQTLDSERGYAFTGDWEPDRIPDLRGHVDRLHQLGMRVLLWYSVPFVGVKSRAYQRFKDKLLYMMEERGAGVLDPRHDDVREYLIGTWEKALCDWDLDGLKLDFVDRFVMRPESPAGGGELMAAVDRLLRDAMDRLRRARPDAMVEFRQPYIGPLMRRYGNMFRANDCPADLVRNRIAVLDVRLLAGNTAVHGDMLMWHPAEPVESAALQLCAVLFSVPQISVRLDRLPEPHLAMLRFWLGFWRRHRATLLDGELSAAAPELNYPLAWARGRDEIVAAAYADLVVSLPPAPRIFVVNATRGEAITVALTDRGARRVRVRDCRGLVVEEAERALGCERIAVPPAGLIEISG
jgi:alpha-galactosidase